MDDLSWHARKAARALEALPAAAPPPERELLLFALKRAKTLSVYYCSCGTQELIASRGLARRRRKRGPAAQGEPAC